ncbi:tRNA lysidine(34) synthetase TilS [Halobacteriovorax sp. GFR7]|uniref:tRNA lysidine(34) synthetase TilS n=1 Tax=unclassified Halobacteriovorax TaxID=2639665 RepID=UPI003D99B72A
MNFKPKQKKSHSTTERMISHFKKFNLKMGLDLNSPMAVACSGGVDSMVLAHMLIQAGAENLRLLHINHGTRKEIEEEVNLVSSFAKKYGLGFETYKVEQLSLKTKNFESVARAKRYQLLLSNLRGKEILLTGHHLDDCFEWSLMQQFKSSAKHIDLGMPYRNGIIYRPLFAFSKNHILKYAKLTNLEWLEDRSNEDTRYERNFIRDLTKNSIAKRFPGYLKHYCNRMNRLKAIKGDMAESHHFKVLRREWGILIEFDGVINEAIEQEVLSQSGSSKGKTHSQFEKLRSLIKTSSIGPLTFSGGLRVYNFKNHLAVVRKGQQMSFYRIRSQIPEGVPFLSNNTSAKHSLKKCPIASRDGDLNKFFSQILLPVHYSWRKNGKVLVWL